METVKLKVGDHFRQAWRGCQKPLLFTVISIDRDKNTLRVKCTGVEGYSHEENWDDLDVAENAFTIGEYKMI